MTSTPQVLVLSNGETSAKIDLVQTKKTAAILRAVNHKLRQTILSLLNENQKMTVTEIYVKLRIEQSVASQHLAILRRANIVLTKREGKFIFYSVNYARIVELGAFMDEFLK
ncbi:MAG: metalloregulator ArsR/SmtB family transcription factor [Flavobacterium sp.]|nr:metalloregulator ArsR/SmtB family transcription factor [Flavobacterium sp.]